MIPNCFRSQPERFRWWHRHCSKRARNTCAAKKTGRQVF